MIQRRVQGRPSLGRSAQLLKMLLFLSTELDMKFVAGSIVIVAGLVIAAGSALMGRTDNSAAEQQWGCCPSSKTATARSAEGGCGGSPCQTTFASKQGPSEQSGCLRKSCGDAGIQVIGTKSEGCCGSPCARGPCPVSGQGCGTDAEPVMISTEAADGKACKAACTAPAQDEDAAY